MLHRIEGVLENYKRAIDTLPFGIIINDNEKKKTTAEIYLAITQSSHNS